MFTRTKYEPVALEDDDTMTVVDDTSLDEDDQEKTDAELPAVLTDGDWTVRVSSLAASIFQERRRLQTQEHRDRLQEHRDRQPRRVRRRHPAEVQTPGRSSCSSTDDDEMMEPLTMFVPPEEDWTTRTSSSVKQRTADNLRQVSQAVQVPKKVSHPPLFIFFLFGNL